MPQVLGFFENYDYIGITYPTDTTEVFTYRNGGASGSVESIVTVTYSDATKAQIVSVYRTEQS